MVMMMVECCCHDGCPSVTFDPLLLMCIISNLSFAFIVLSVDVLSEQIDCFLFTFFTLMDFSTSGKHKMSSI